MSQDTNVDSKENKDDEKKVEEKNGEEKKDEEKKEEKKEDPPVIIRVDMHCKACEDRVKKALDGCPGVENVHTDMKNQTVIVKGKVVVRKVFEILKKKSGRRAILLSPELEEEKKQDETIKEPVESSVVLKVKMHCLGCSREVKRGLLKLPGVTSVDVDFANDQVTVKGRDLDPKKVCDGAKKSGKHYEIVPPPPPPPPPPEEEKKEEEKKEEEKKEEKKEEEKKEEEKKEEKPDEKKEEKSNEKNDDKASGETKIEIKKYEYGMYTSFPEYVYPPQLFSDENPNACHVM